VNRNLRLFAAVAVLVALVGVGAAGLLSGSGGSGSAGTGTPTSLVETTGVPTGGVGTDPDSGLQWVAQSALPPEAQQTLALIDQGGPFPYDEDGEVFGNYEGILPAESQGYYHEYTVVTPGASTRGARRIITGSHGEFYWTADHYESFSRIARST
jgi:ribonuclease T1